MQALVEEAKQCGEGQAYLHEVERCFVPMKDLLEEFAFQAVFSKG